MSDENAPVIILKGGAGTGALLSRDDLEVNESRESAEFNLKNALSTGQPVNSASTDDHSNAESPAKPAQLIDHVQEAELPFGPAPNSVLSEKPQDQVLSESRVDVGSNAIPAAQEKSASQPAHGKDLTPLTSPTDVSTQKTVVDTADSRRHDGELATEKNEQPSMERVVEPQEESSSGGLPATKESKSVEKNQNDNDTAVNTDGQPSGAEEYSSFQQEMIEIFRDLKKEDKPQEAAEEKKQPEDTPDPTSVEFEEVLTEPINTNEEESSSLEVEEISYGLSSGVMFGLIGLSSLILGGVVAWVMSSAKDIKDKRVSPNEDVEKKEVEDASGIVKDVKTSDEEFEEIVINSEEKEVVVDVVEKIPEEPQNKKPISKDIILTLDGDSPYSIDKNGFFFRDDDDDSLRGLVIKSLPERGELKSKGDDISEDQFFKIDDLPDIDDIEFTYHLEKDQEPSSFDFALVSGESVISQQSSDDYTYTFESPNLAGLSEQFMSHDLNADSYFPLYDGPII